MRIRKVAGPCSLRFLVHLASEDRPLNEKDAGDATAMTPRTTPWPMLRVLSMKAHVGFAFVFFAKRVTDSVRVSVCLLHLLAFKSSTTVHLRNLPSGIVSTSRVILATKNSIAAIWSDHFRLQLLVIGSDYTLVFIVFLSFNIHIKLGVK